MPKGVRLCSVFKAAFYSVMRDSAKKDVEEKRLRLQRRAGGTHNSEESSDNSDQSGGSPTGDCGGRGL